MSKTCPYCGPLPVNHLNAYFSNLLDYFFSGLARHTAQKKIWRKFEQNAGRGLIFFLEKLGALSYEEVQNIERGKIYNRTLVLLDEARKRGISAGAAKFFGRYNNHFFAKIHGRRFVFEGLPGASSFEKPEGIFIDDKWELKLVLKDRGLPFAPGGAFWSKSAAKNFSTELGFPLVVKPRWGSISRHVFLDIKSERELNEAIGAVKKICPSFLVEKYLAGTDVFRATVVGGKLGGIVKRTPANVVGDGENSVEELVRVKNSDRRRGEPKQKDCTFLRIVIDGTSERLLSAQGLGFNSVPERGRRVFLQEKVILDLGADLTEMTDIAHPDNLFLFEEIAGIFGAKIVGIDFLCKNISASWKEQKCAIIELNSLPFIDMHHFPLEGQPKNIAAMIWDMVEGEIVNS